MIPETAPAGRLERAHVDGVDLEYEVRGTGEPVVLIHAGLLADWFAPLLDQPAIARSFRTLSYHRPGYAGSPGIAGPLDIARQAALCHGLMRHVGIERAHIVGHSSSAAMALQLALDAPGAVRSVTLLETALLIVPSGPYAAEAMGLYRAGKRADALDAWMRGVCGPDYRSVLDRTIPAAFDQALADLDTFFEQELPALRGWSFDAEAAARVTQPALVVLGATSGEVSPVFAARHELLMAWLPNAEPFVLPGANHLLHAQNPSEMAGALVDFVGRHSLASA
jgi:pimeloyl-ACP methyl ester carboxylesterase